MKKTHQPVKGSILIVEDEKIIAKDIANILKKFGYVVPAIVSSGEEAVRKLEDTPVDLILMDIVLKGNVDGVEAAKQIHERFQTPIVHLTAYADDETLDRIKEAQPFGYIIKPFKERELYCAVEMALHRHRVALEKVATEQRKIEDTRHKLQRLEQFTEVKGNLFKKFLQELSDPLLNVKMAVSLLKDNLDTSKRDYYLKVIEDEFNREIELINQTSNLEELLNVENVELLSQFSLLRKQGDISSSPSSSFSGFADGSANKSTSTGGGSPVLQIASEKTAPVQSAGKTPSQIRPLNQTQLAERLGVVVSAITYWKFKAGFSDWSRSKDPEGISWKYSPESKRFSPGVG